MRTLTMKEEKRIAVIQRVFRGELTMGKASLVLGISERQCYMDGQISFVAGASNG